MLYICASRLEGKVFYFAVYNSTRCRDGVGVSWCSRLVWFHPCLHVLVFGKKTLLCLVSNINVTIISLQVLVQCLCIHTQYVTHTSHTVDNPRFTHTNTALYSRLTHIYITTVSLTHIHITTVTLTHIYIPSVRLTHT